MPLDKVMSPPVSVLLVPTLKSTFPPLPFVADPVVKAILPLLPLLAVPLVNDKNPLTPNTPALEVCTMIEPLDFVVPAPAEILREPPVCSFVSPVLIEISPPSDVVPVPTDMNTLPPLPVSAAPVDICISPEEPELVVPDKNDKEPLTPVVPALSVFTIILPDDDLVPTPVVKLAKPPVPLVPTPAVKDKSPPAETGEPIPLPPFILKDPPKELSLLVEPVSNFNSPPTPTSPGEIPTETDPAFPFTAEPTFRLNAPLEPEEVVPDRNVSSPETPSVPALRVIITIYPLLETVDKPV